MTVSPGMFNALFQLAEAAPVLDKTEAALRLCGNKDAADALLKLQQDVGVTIDREFNGYDPAAPAPGPETARLNAAYKPVTPERLSGALRASYAALPDGEAKKEFGVFLETVALPVPVPAEAKAKSPKPL